MKIVFHSVVLLAKSACRLPGWLHVLYADTILLYDQKKWCNGLHIPVHAHSVYNIVRLVNCPCIYQYNVHTYNSDVYVVMHSPDLTP